MVVIANDTRILARRTFHIRRSEFIIVIGMVKISRYTNFKACRTRNAVYQMACTDRRFVCIKARKTVRCVHRICRAFLGHNVNGTARAVCRKTRRYIAFINLDIRNLVDRNIVKSQISLSFDRNAVDKHLDVLAFHAANVYFTFAAHSARLANFHSRCGINRLGNALARILQFGGINRRNRFDLFRNCSLLRFRFCFDRK